MTANFIRWCSGPEKSVVETRRQFLVVFPPVPVVDEIRDTVLDGPLDMPVGDLGPALLVPAQQRIALGKSSWRRHRLI